ncbi:MAG: lytic murein transglycosylase [Sulfitobacter sp.]
MRWPKKIVAIFGLILMSIPASAAGPEASIRPSVRSATAALAGTSVQGVASQGFDDWIVDFRPRAIAAGVAPDTFDQAMKGLKYDAKIIKRDRNQAEFTKTIWDYLDTAASDLRVQNGRKALLKWDVPLSKIEAEYGVKKQVIVAIWGLESAYGTFRGSVAIINALATLAYDARRAAFFENELLEALLILQNGDTTRALMQGSWAGAMGHTQFMPSSFQAYAVDFDGDGKRNIWEDDPRDALASTAAYLKHFGWTHGQPWGIEVRLPDDFDFELAARKTLKHPTEWAALGLTPVAGRFEDEHGPASILLPGGGEGAAFMIFANFAVIEKYNTADAYVIGVGHLSDRISGGGAIEQKWPRRLRALSKEERIELQERLTTAGFDTVKIDAKMGPLTINAVRRFQKSIGQRPDGYPSLAILDRLRAR